jgi:hypothetical protein
VAWVPDLVEPGSRQRHPCRRQVVTVDEQVVLGPIALAESQPADAGRAQGMARPEVRIGGVGRTVCCCRRVWTGVLGRVAWVAHR